MTLVRWPSAGAVRGATFFSCSMCTGLSTVRCGVSAPFAEPSAPSAIGTRKLLARSCGSSALVVCCAPSVEAPPRLAAGTVLLRSVHEGAHAGCRAPYDERLHFARPLVGVQRLRVGHEAADMVVEQDAIAAQQLTRVANALAHLHRAVGLGHGGVLVLEDSRLF